MSHLSGGPGPCGYHVLAGGGSTDVVWGAKWWALPVLGRLNPLMDVCEHQGCFLTCGDVFMYEYVCMCTCVCVCVCYCVCVCVCRVFLMSQDPFASSWLQWPNTNICARHVETKSNLRCRVNKSLTDIHDVNTCMFTCNSGAARSHRHRPHGGLFGSPASVDQ